MCPEKSRATKRDLALLSSSLVSRSNLVVVRSGKGTTSIYIYIYSFQREYGAEEKRKRPRAEKEEAAAEKNRKSTVGAATTTTTTKEAGPR